MSYTYYVGTLSRYVLVQASNARGALEAGEAHPELNGGTILTIRVASQDEVELMTHLEQMKHVVPIKDHNKRFHFAPFANWYAEQESKDSVTIFDRDSDQSDKVRPPNAWGRNWKWNVSEDGTGIDLHRID